MPEKKYAWDISVERTFSSRQLENVDTIARIIAFGGNVKELKVRMKQLALL